MIIAEGLTAIVLGIIFYEDFRFRGVRWYYFLLLLLLLVWQFIIEGGESRFLVINFGFILSQISLITLYFYIKHGSLKAIDNYIGWGDIIMWGLLAFAFSPLNYVLFFILSTFFSLIAYLIFRNGKNKTIPLAGLQSLFLLLLTGSQMLGFSLESLNDYWLIELLYEY